MADANALSITARHDIIAFLDLPAQHWICHSMLLLLQKSREVLPSNSSATFGNCPTMNCLETFFLLGRHHLFFVPCLRTVYVALLSEWVGQGFRICEGGYYTFLWIAPSKRCSVFSRRRITSNLNCFSVIIQLTVGMLFPVFLSFSSFSLFSIVPTFSPSPNGSVLEHNK